MFASSSKTMAPARMESNVLTKTKTRTNVISRLDDASKSHLITVGPQILIHKNADSCIPSVTFEAFKLSKNIVQG